MKKEIIFQCKGCKGWKKTHFTPRRGVLEHKTSLLLKGTHLHPRLEPERLACTLAHLNTWTLAHLHTSVGFFLSEAFVEKIIVVMVQVLSFTDSLGSAALVWICMLAKKLLATDQALVTPTIFITFHQNHSSAGFLGRTINCIGFIFIFIIFLAPVFIILFVFSVFIHDWNDGWWCFSDVATKPSRHILCRATPSCATPVPHLPVLQHLVLHLCYTIFCRAGPSGSKPTLTAPKIGCHFTFYPKIGSSHCAKQRFVWTERKLPNEMMSDLLLLHREICTHHRFLLRPGQRLPGQHVLRISGPSPFLLFGGQETERGNFMLERFLHLLPLVSVTYAHFSSHFVVS